MPGDFLSPSPGVSTPAGLPPMRAFGDSLATRKNIYDNTLKAAKEIEPLANDQHTLTLSDVDWADPERFTRKQRKEATLTGGTLGRRLKGTWTLTDNATGKVVDKRHQIVARIPYMTSLGTFVHRGTDYTVNHQARLKPGIYARQKANGELESMANFLPGEGRTHRYSLDPDKGVFKINIGQAEMPLMPLLHAMGASDNDLRSAWGDKLFASNAAKNDSGVIGKLAARILRKNDQGGDEGTTRHKLVSAFEAMKLDPEVSQRTLGHAHATLDKHAILAATKKLLAISLGEAEPDARDDPANQTFHGPEDMFAERIRKDHGGIRRGLFRKISRTGSLGMMPSGVMTPQVEHVITGSGLGQALEEVSPLEVLDRQTFLTRMGEGAIGSVDAIPDEARSVHPGQMGFMDASRTPESLRAGVDTFFASGAKKGSDGQLYKQFRDRQGNLVYKSPRDVATAAVATPDVMKWDTKRVPVTKNGRLTYVPKDQVDYVIPAFESGFSPVANLIPFKSASKPHRVAMGSRYITQALPLVAPEAPLVQSGMPGSGGARSYSEEYGEHAGAVRARQTGRVESVADGVISIRHPDGTQQRVELYQHAPMNRKTELHQTPVVRPGDVVPAGGLLAHSNFTDEQGVAAPGLNMRTGWLPWLGKNHEDAVVISESAAKRMTSSHLYQHDLEISPKHKTGKHAFVGLFPGKFDRAALDTLDDKGVVRPGQKVEFGQPMILAAREKDRAQTKIHRARQPGYADETVTWAHHDPGVVTDVTWGKDGPHVTVRSEMPMRVGDKLCYDAKTQVLTTKGWKDVADVTLSDKVATLGRGDCIEYVAPDALHQYDHAGKMYCLQTTQVDLLVTDNHKLYVKVRGRKEFELTEAAAVKGKRFRMQRNGRWRGQSPTFVIFPGCEVSAGQGGAGVRAIPDLQVDAKTYAMLLGAFLSEGSTFCHPESGSYGIEISQIKPANRAKLLQALDEAGVRCSVHPTGFRLYGIHWLQHFACFGLSGDKYIPQEVFNWGPDLLKILYEWLMWGDGSRTGSSHAYHTTSRQLADDVQRLVFHLGMSANVTTAPGRWMKIKGKRYWTKRRYRVGILRTKNCPEINHGHSRQQRGQREQWQKYGGKVYCVTMPKNHVIYVRRNGKPVWCGNSGLYGDKGVVADIIPEHRMPRGEDGRPLELLLGSDVVTTRANPSQLVEGALGKIAAMTGRPYKVPDFEDDKDLVQWADAELKKHGLKSTETVYWPDRDKKIPNVGTGVRYVMKLHHQAESKVQGRSGGSYDAEDAPAKGGPSGSKRLALLDVNSLISHGAINTLRDAKVRGTRNDRYWLQFMSGHTPPLPTESLAHEKFVALLKGAGVNITKEGHRLHVMAMTDRDVDTLAGDRELKNGETVNFDKEMKPVPGGLFDQALTGGHGGRQWAKLSLPGPYPNPVLEEPIRRVLGLTQKQLEGTIEGTHALEGHGTGPGAIASALGAIDLDRELAKVKADFHVARGGAKDAAARRWDALAGAKTTGIHPKDWVMTKLPVLPPVFRPVSVLGDKGVPLVSDANYLYREAVEAVNAHKTMKDLVGGENVGAEHAAVYHAIKAVTGLGEPSHPKLVEKKVKGLLKSVLGAGPKTSFLQRKLLSSTVDNVGRAVVVPDPEYDMDTLGVPEGQAFDIFRRFVARRLHRRGLPLREALRHVQDRTPLARSALQQEMDERPVLMNRAPVWHKFGALAFRPKLVAGDTVRVPPLVVKGLGMDFDGDAVQIHVPTTDEAVREYYDRLLPSKNLLSPADFSTPMHAPGQSYVAGLYHATKELVDKQKHHKTFRRRADVLAAYARGDLDASEAVQTLED